MMKKLFLIGLTFFVAVQAQDTDLSDRALVFQKLVYSVGMHLTEQEDIIDLASVKTAVKNMYHDVAPCTHIINLWMHLDEEVVKNDITTIDEFIDYEITIHDNVLDVGVIWLAAYQNLFVHFRSLHQDNSTFERWCADKEFFLESTRNAELVDFSYVGFWKAARAMLTAHVEFKHAYKNYE